MLAAPSDAEAHTHLCEAQWATAVARIRKHQTPRMASRRHLLTLFVCPLLRFFLYTHLPGCHCSICLLIDLSTPTTFKSQFLNYSRATRKPPFLAQPWYDLWVLLKTLNPMYRGHFFHLFWACIYLFTLMQVAVNAQYSRLWLDRNINSKFSAGEVVNLSIAFQKFLFSSSFESQTLAHISC